MLNTINTIKSIFNLLSSLIVLFYLIKLIYYLFDAFFDNNRFNIIEFFENLGSNCFNFVADLSSVFIAFALSIFSSKQKKHIILLLNHCTRYIKLCFQLLIILMVSGFILFSVLCYIYLFYKCLHFVIFYFISVITDSTNIDILTLISIFYKTAIFCIFILTIDIVRKNFWEGLWYILPISLLIILNSAFNIALYWSILFFLIIITVFVLFFLHRVKRIIVINKIKELIFVNIVIDIIYGAIQRASKSSISQTNELVDPS